MNFLSSINNFSLSGSSDWLLSLVFLAVAFIYGFSMGRNRLVIVTLGIYFSYLIAKAVPWSELAFLGIGKTPDSNIQIFVFLALILAFYFLIPRSAFHSALRLGGRRRGNWWQVFVFSILQVGLILALVVSFLPTNIISGLSPMAKIIFVGPLPQFFWLFLPIVALMFLKGARHYDVD